MCYKLSYRNPCIYLKLFEFCRKIYNLAENALTKVSSINKQLLVVINALSEKQFN